MKGQKRMKGKNRLFFYTSKGINRLFFNHLIPYRVYFIYFIFNLYLLGYIYLSEILMNPIAKFIKERRRAAGYTQEEFALRSGLGLRFIRDLEQGKPTVRMDKVNVALGMFNMQAGPVEKEREIEK